MNLKKKLLIIIAVVAVIAGFIFVGLPVLQKGGSGENAGQGQQTTCVKEERPLEITGSSLSGILEQGDKVTALIGYYDCNEVKRGDIVLYNWVGGSPLPLAKIAMGIPGDKFGLKQAGSVWNILINGAVAKNSKGEPYTVVFVNRLNLYINDYKGVIPKDTYLLLGNTSAGSEDSTVFGLAGKQDFLGKIQK